jgi:hypothetical protein
MILSRDEHTPAHFDPALHQVRFAMLDGGNRVLGYVSVQVLANAAKRERINASSLPLELFHRFRDRIEKAAQDEFDKGRTKTIQVRDPIPFVWVAAF